MTIEPLVLEYLQKKNMGCLNRYTVASAQRLQAITSVKKLNDLKGLLQGR